MRTADFDYFLPQELIAQHPIEQRDASRLLTLDRTSGAIAHRQFAELESLLQPGDVLVANNSRVIPARVRGQKEGDGARVEILLTEKHAPSQWWCMLRPGKRIHNGTRIQLHDLDGHPTQHWVEAISKNNTGKYLLRLPDSPSALELLQAIGETPLPPYIERAPIDTRADRDRYQTVYAMIDGSVAAPTAGLHFTDELLDRLRAKDVTFAEVTLHVGPGTFQPVECERIENHPMHKERFEIATAAAETVNQAKAEGRRVVAVGTTSMRVLESVAIGGVPIAPQLGRTDIFIYPPHEFLVVDALLTNFHLPKSTLLMLVSAFAQPGGTSGCEHVLRAYAEAVANRYRFFSYGDAMFLH
ncbi:MAG TPA: tRNA preQ1(34) S-adenosylmethionine ribosyltransferase-isomerase QueA [Verrucomicrobiota bacterium]|nr:tRNA preQ1(34) S-adenosylmethionine ribosyltransferase-isomerase QueA [Verrucomicrobiota bacterium]